MRRRFLFPLLWAAPALLASVVVAAFLAGGAAGFLWIFVFGDDPWPAAAGAALPVLFVTACVALWAALLWLAYAAGERQEERTLAAKDVIAPLAVTGGLVLLIVLQQLSVGAIGPQPDSVVCSRLCQDNGFAASGTPPRNTGNRTCTCYDAQGREALSPPLGGRQGR